MASILLISGTIGNILICIVFIRRTLRQNSCSFYFFVTSISNIITLFFGCLIRILLSFNVNPSLPVYCKIRSFFTMLGLSSSACADRYASSSSNVRIRKFSHVKIAQKLTIIMTIIICFAWSQMYINIYIWILTVRNIHNQPIHCSTQNKER